jgi:hypothetical protein
LRHWFRGAGVTLCIGAGLLLRAAVAGAQLSEPDTTPAVRPQLPTVEPRRLARQVTGPQQIVAMRYPQAQEGRDTFSAAVPELVEFLAKEVPLPGLRYVAGQSFFSDPGYEDALLLYLSGDRAELDLVPQHKTRLRHYLVEGGLLYAEDVRALPLVWRSDVASTGTPFDRQFKALMVEVLGADGRDWQVVAKDHPLYSAYFTFPDGPPLTSVARRRALQRIQELEMLETRGRVSVVFSELNIGSAWANPTAEGRRRALQFGANVVVFAMAQYAATGLQLPSP